MKLSSVNSINKVDTIKIVNFSENND